jgi:hypothetical protein
MPFDLSDEERGRIYAEHVKKTGRSRAHNVAAFFQATFDAWKDFKRSGRERVYVGYSPIITVDAAAILSDMPNAHFLHIVRNPWSAYADTKKRPVPLSLDKYILAWTLNQYFALLVKEQFPKRLHVVRTEDVMANSTAALGPVCDALGIERAPSLAQPSWNGTPLEEVYPWGTIRKATPAQNKAEAQSLSAGERDAIRQRAWQYLDVFDYRSFV